MGSCANGSGGVCQSGLDGGERLADVLNGMNGHDLKFDIDGAVSMAYSRVSLQLFCYGQPMKFQLTVICESAAELAEATARLAAPAAVLLAADHPSAGFPMDPPNPFASAAAAPASVAAAVVPIAPVVPVASAPVPTPAATPIAPLPVPVAPVPAAPVAPTIPVPGAAELDSRGMPWDTRIHAANRGKVTSGQWRAKKNVEDSLVVQVEAELRATMAARAPGSVVPAAPLPAAQLGIVPADAAPIPPAVPVAETFQMFMVRVGPRVQEPANMVKLIEACNQCGLPSLGSLASRADLLPAVGAIFDASVA